MKTYGKIILIGEHSVVYNHKAIAIPFKTGYIETVLEESQEWEIHSRVFNGKIAALDQEFEHLKMLVYKLRDELKLTPLKLVITSTLPISAGLGSSAAVASSITKSMFDYKKQPLSQETLFDYVQFSERIAHGVSSGIDTLITTTSNGYIFSRDGEKKVLDYSIDAYLVIGNSKQKGSTKHAVETVKEHVLNKNGKQQIELLGDLAIQFYQAMQNNQIQLLGTIMNRAESALANLGLETTALKSMIDLANKNGALGVKLTGAGLGGCVIALAETKAIASSISSSWEDKGYDSWIMDMKEAI